MAIAYFIMVHHKPAEFEWLMQAISDPEDLILVHVDLKSRLGLKADRRGLMREVRRICAGRPNVVLMRSRFTNWGGWSLSRILLDAIGQALSHPLRWDHFVNLSGQCYPVKPLAAIRQAIAAAGDNVHVELRALDSLPDDDWHRAMRPMLETPLRAFKLPGRRRPPRGFALTHKGSQWVILPRRFCEWLDSAPLRRRIARYMRSLHLTDELIMQALVTNGPYAGRVTADYGRAILWPGPKVLTSADLPFLLHGPALFARKFDLARDATVLAELAAAGGYAPGPRPTA